MPPSKPPKIRLIHYLGYFAYRTFEFVLRVFPMEMVATLGHILGSIGWAIMPQRRRTVIRNLRIAHGDQFDLAQIKSLCRQTFKNATANLLTSLRINTLKPGQLEDYIELQGSEHLTKIREANLGAIYLLAHMGNWEALSHLQLPINNPAPFAGLYRPIDNPLLDNLVKRRRENSGTKLFSKRDGFFKPIAHLKSGGNLGAIADQNARHHGMALPLFGKLTSMSNLPALMHRRAGTPIIPISVCTVTPGRWVINIHPPIDVPSERKKDTHYVSTLCCKAYEKMMSESPADVLWMHNYWRISQRRPLKIFGVKKEGYANNITQPFHILVYTGNDDEDAQETITQLERLRAYRSDIYITTAGQYPVYAEADHHIPCNPGEPPHLSSNAIQAYETTRTSPIDCALDFTDDGSGSCLLEKAGLSTIRGRQGKWMSEQTREIYQKHNDKSISLFLTSLGLNDISQEN